MQFISNDKTVKSDRVQGIKDFYSQLLLTQAKRGEQLVSMMSGIEKTFDIMGDDIVDCSSEDDAKNKVLK